MRLTLFLLCLIAGAPAAAQTPIGLFHRWGVFQQVDAARCYAIAKPSASTRRQSHVAISFARGTGGQFYARLGGGRRAGSAILLKIDGRSFQLAGNAAHAWASSPGADAAIVAAMRTGVGMSVETRDARGLRTRDNYALRGAASAIDAAAVACASRRWKNAAIVATSRAS